MKLKDITRQLENWAPITLQESYDNSGYIIGNPETELNSILITLDCTEEVIKEAIEKKCNLIVAHHPILFKPLKSITGKSYIERAIILAIKNDIAIYAFHTNLDNIKTGVNLKICEKLSLRELRILAPKSGNLKKLIVFTPENFNNNILSALHLAGAGNLGNYSECSFSSNGRGSFKPNLSAKPAVGKAGILEFVEENKIEVIFPSHVESKVIAALNKAHPYEEPAYDIIALDNLNSEVGSGMIGTLSEPMSELDFLNFIKINLNVSLIRHSPLLGKAIHKVALCGGSGSFLLNNAKIAGADIFISSDFKYHEFFDADKSILIADINHYEGEVFTKELIYEFLKEKIANIALVLSDVKTNPISYL